MSGFILPMTVLLSVMGFLQLQSLGQNLGFRINGICEKELVAFQTLEMKDGTKVNKCNDKKNFWKACQVV